MPLSGRTYCDECGYAAPFNPCRPCEILALQAEVQKHKEACQEWIDAHRSQSAMLRSQNTTINRLEDECRELRAQIEDKKESD